MRFFAAFGTTTLLVLALAALTIGQNECGQGDDDDSPTPIQNPRLLVGASVLTILPEVGGSTAYFDPIREGEPLALEPGDPGTDPGVFVEEWDVGTIAIGNGFPTSHWVHDEIRTGAIAFKDAEDTEGGTLVLVTVDVYMMFKQDIQDVYDKVRARIGDEAFRKLTILVSATHNHMGPDTSGLDGINADYYNYMTDQIAQAVVFAIDENTMRLAELHLASTHYQFGLNDGHAPFIVDNTLNSMQAIASDDGSVLATVMQWQSHPEDTLFWGDDVYATEEQAEYLRSIDECNSNDGGAHCYIEGQYISAGFPGYAVRRVMDQTGAPALYFNGTVGAMQSPDDAAIWETEGPDGKPAGDGIVVPDGAILLDENFHLLAVNGNELGKRVLEDLKYGEPARGVPIRATRQTFYSRLSNFGFRVGMVVLPNGQPLQLGLHQRELYTCPATGEKSDRTCTSDRYQMMLDPVTKYPMRVGDHLESEVWYLRIGPVGILTIPGEAVPEINEGLPSDFYDDPRDTYYVTDQNKTNNVVGTAYVTDGYLRQAMPDKYKWTFGLTQDEGGYTFPISNWRIFCVADEDDLGGQDGNCAALWEAGIMDYQDYDGQMWSISGEHCKQITEDPSLLEAPPYTNFPDGAMWAQYSCAYGQAWDEVDGHYEETNSAGWDIALDWTAAAKLALGWTGDLQQVNPEFVSYPYHAP